MDTQSFREFLAERNLSESVIAASVAMAEKFEAFLEIRGHSDATKEDVILFSYHLIEKGENFRENYYALVRYGRFIGNDDVYIGFVDLCDGAEAMENLFHKAGNVLGVQRRDSIFEGVQLPPFGSPNQDKVAITQTIMDRLVKKADPQECDRILSDSLRDLDDEWYADEKKLYAECQDIDEFLDKNAQHFIAMLEKIHDEGGLFFTQKITEEVIEYVRNEPLIVRGVRDGNTLYEVKIPHMTAEFLAEPDLQTKRYYYCHCPWVKASLKNGKAQIPATFCSCSAGFHKKRWEVILEQPLKAEIVESVLKGDDWCKIAIHLPESFFVDQETPTLI